MTFFSFKSSTLRATLILAAATLSACVPGLEFRDDAGDWFGDVPAADGYGPVTDAGSNMRTLACAPSGAASLQVGVQLAPTLPQGDLWVALYCGTRADTPIDELIPARIVRVAREPGTMTMVENLGEGYYRVFASIAGVPSGDSGATPVRITGALTGATFVTVNPTPSQPLLDLNGPMAANVDAGGVPLDGSVPVTPGGPMDFTIRSPMLPARIGRLELNLRPRSDGLLDASFSMANLLPAMSDPILRLTNIELRIEHSGEPHTLLSIPIVPQGVMGNRPGAVLRGGQQQDTESRVVPGDAFAAGTRFRLTVFGAIE